MSERTLAHVLRIVIPDDVLVPCVASFVVLTETITQPRIGGRPKRRR